MDSVALISPGKSDATYRDLVQAVEQTRRQLATFGIVRGIRIGLAVSERDSMAVAYLAAIGTTTVAPLNASSTPDELEFSIRDFGLTFVILQEAKNELQERASSMGVEVIILTPDASRTGVFNLSGTRCNPGAEPTLARPDDIQVVLHTSGTTSRPKIVPRPQHFILNMIEKGWGDRQLRPGDTTINGLPLHHIQGLDVELLPALVNGATVVLTAFNPSEFFQLLEMYRPATFTLVPSMHQMVVDSIPAGKPLPINVGLRWVSSSSSKLSLRLRTQMETVYGVPIREGYGATEVDTGLILNRLSREGVPEGSVGKRAHGGVVIMDSEGVIVDSGVVGEICVDDNHTIDGYENNPEANVAAFRPGYYRTGDQGYLDGNEYLFVFGRITEAISRGGESISPSEIDEVLVQHIDVSQAATFGIKDVRVDHEIWAAVVPRNGATININAIRAFAGSKLSFAKVPKRIIVLDELPRNEMGKVVRQTLTDRFEQKSH